MKLVLIFLLLVAFVQAKSSTDKEIKRTSSKIQTYSKNYSRLNKKMADTANKILLQKRSLEKQEKYLKALEKELSLKELSYKEDTSQLKLLKKSQEKLQSQQDKIETKLTKVISKTVSLTVVLDGASTQNEESLIEGAVLKSMLKREKEKGKALSEKFLSNSESIEFLNKHASTLESAISNIDQKRKKLLKTKKANKEALQRLTSSKKSYKKELKKTLNRQSSLKKTLAKLNLIKVDEIRRAREEAERKDAFDKNPVKVKKHGSSYQAVKTKRYTGKKTIAPLDSYTITKKYGTYTDPIYGIKIFNESISLKPKKANAKVKTVFNGKVVYADKTAVLNNIVIIQHSNGLHTIYANLSKISPNIKKGKKIKRGYTIGRVKDELIFEVTKKSFHINPIELFK